MNSLSLGSRLGTAAPLTRRHPSEEYSFQGQNSLVELGLLDGFGGSLLVGVGRRHAVLDRMEILNWIQEFLREVIL